MQGIAFKARTCIALVLFLMLACRGPQQLAANSAIRYDLVRELNGNAPCPHFNGALRSMDDGLTAAIMRSVDETQVPIVKPTDAVEFGQAFANAKPFPGRAVLLYNLALGGGSVFWLSSANSALFCVSYARNSLGNTTAFVRWIAHMQSH